MFRKWTLDGSAPRDTFTDGQDSLKKLQPMGQISEVNDIVDAIVYLTEAHQVTGEVPHVTAVHTLANGKRQRVSASQRRPAVERTWHQAEGVG
jgi:hypothetical protein